MKNCHCYLTLTGEFCGGWVRLKVKGRVRSRSRGGGEGFDWWHSPQAQWVHATCHQDSRHPTRHQGLHKVEDLPHAPFFHQGVIISARCCQVSGTSASLDHKTLRISWRALRYCGWAAPCCVPWFSQVSSPPPPPQLEVVQQEQRTLLPSCIFSVSQQPCSFVASLSWTSLSCSASVQLES